MEVEGISTIFMFVSDLPRSQDFYQKLIGKEPSRQRENLFASFQIGGVNLLLHSDANATWLPAGAKKGVGMALHLQVKEIDAHWKRLNELGIPLSEEPSTLHTGIRKFAMKDPDGYEVEFVEPPTMPDRENAHG
ncbi:MAG: VOC family protein [Chloroflexi bacterium]|nr:VOC family protein [Chloroflexota bacterium]